MHYKSLTYLHKSRIFYSNFRRKNY